MFDDVRAVADAVLFEGYALYPYRASAPKNQMRWQFGVVAPRAWSEGAAHNDRWWQETQCLIEPALFTARLTGCCRFLQLRRREGSDATPPWDEGDIQEVDFRFALSGDGARDEQVVSFLIAGGTDARGPVVHRRWPISGAVRLTVEPVSATRRVTAWRSAWAWIAMEPPAGV